jgi:cytoskeletal protein CcmA (bactofilin family)|tara:strand:- start:30 stop:440 length:411 start_codon:yes stop_codon:yes gene_type:complete
MAFKRKKKFQLDTLIDADMIIRGNTTLTGGIRLDGKIYGNLTVLDGQDGTLIMGENSVIKGNVIVPTAIIGGKITGNIKCLDYLEVHSNAVINGDIEYNLIELHAGAKINSRLKIMTKSEIKKETQTISKINKEEK